MKLINTIWISTAPRTGSMWLFNVTREIFRIVGQVVEPEITPQKDEEMIRLATQFSFTSQDPTKVWVLKVHQILRPDLPQSKILTTHRDLRDVLVSYKEFMNTSFDNALGCARAVVHYTETYEKYDPSYLMLVSYNDIETRPVELIQEIAKFLDIQISEANAKKIALKYSRKNIRSIIKKSDKLLAKKIAKKKTPDHRDIVRLSTTNYRAFDRKTGFQTGHVTQRKTGDWKKALSTSEQQRLDAEFSEWLKKFSYLE